MSKQKNMTGQIATLKKVMHYLKHYIPILILSVVLATVTVELTLYFPILTGRPDSGQRKCGFSGDSCNCKRRRNCNWHHGCGTVDYEYVQ